MVSRQQVFGKLSIIILTGQQSQVDRWEWITFTVEGGLLHMNVPRLQVWLLVESLTGVQYSGISQTCIFLTINLIHLLCFDFIPFDLNYLTLPPASDVWQLDVETNSNEVNMNVCYTNS